MRRLLLPPLFLAVSLPFSPGRRDTMPGQAYVCVCGTVNICAFENEDGKGDGEITGKGGEFTLFS